MLLELPAAEVCPGDRLITFINPAMDKPATVVEVVRPKHDGRYPVVVLRTSRRSTTRVCPGDDFTAVVDRPPPAEPDLDAALAEMPYVRALEQRVVDSVLARMRTDPTFEELPLVRATALVQHAVRVTLVTAALMREAGGS